MKVDLVLKKAATASGGGGGSGYSQWIGGGGGGGYSGGGAGDNGGGGGGGSIIDSSATAILAEVSGLNSPEDPTNGEIIITAVSAPYAITTAAAFGFTNGVLPGFDVFRPVRPSNAVFTVEWLATDHPGFRCKPICSAAARSISPDGEVHHHTRPVVSTAPELSCLKY